MQVMIIANAFYLPAPLITFARADMMPPCALQTMQNYTSPVGDVTSHARKHAGCGRINSCPQRSRRPNPPDATSACTRLRTEEASRARQA